MGAMEFQVTGASIVYSTVCSGGNKRKHQSSASLAFVRGIHLWPVNSPQKRANNVENVSIWWRHYVIRKKKTRDATESRCLKVHYNIIA